MKPYKCPVCEGRGIVPGGFYASIGPYSTSTSVTEPCRACEGTGIIWGNEGVKLVGEVEVLKPIDYGEHDCNNGAEEEPLSGILHTEQEN